MDTNSHIEIPQEWNFYSAYIESEREDKPEGEPASIRLNLALMPLVPIQELDKLIIVYTYIQTPNEYNFPTSEEFPLLRNIEDSITKELVKTGALAVGVVTGAGRMVLYFYGPPGCDYEAIVDQAMQAHDTHPYAVVLHDDKEWGLYKDYLFPDEYQYQCIQNNKVLIALEEKGDIAERARDIDHFIYFKTQVDSSNFADKVRPLGYDVQVNDDQVDLSEEYPYTLQAIRKDDLLRANLHKKVWELVQLANECNGIYDGWGCSIVNE